MANPNNQHPDGLYGKYIIQKANGKPLHIKSEYFVLRLDTHSKDLNHIAACRKAVNVYAQEIKPYLPELAKDLTRLYPILPRSVRTQEERANELMETLISQMRDNKKFQETVINAVYNHFLEKPGITLHSFVLEAAKIYRWPLQKPL
jgi:hypothetical protein